MKVSYAERQNINLTIVEFLDLLKTFQNQSQINFYIETEFCFLIFYWHEQTDLWVEILHGEPAQIYSEIFLTEVQKILEIACENGTFGYKIPNTNEFWDSHRGSENNK